MGWSRLLFLAAPGFAASLLPGSAARRPNILLIVPKTTASKSETTATPTPAPPTAASWLQRVCALAALPFRKRAVGRRARANDARRLETALVELGGGWLQSGSASGRAKRIARWSPPKRQPQQVQARLACAQLENSEHQVPHDCASDSCREAGRLVVLGPSPRQAPQHD